MNVRHLTADDVLRIHYVLVEMFARQRDPIVPAGARDIGLVESAISRPQTASRGNEKYKTIESKAAALFHSLVMNHAFHNGNKRTALVSLLVFLNNHKRRVDVSEDSLFEFVLSVANDELKRKTPNGTADEVVEEITKWIKHNTRLVDYEAKPMRTRDFIEACSKAGARCTLRDGTWNIIGLRPRSGFSLSNETKQLDKSVIKRYLQRLGIVSPISGVYFDEFEIGLRPEQEMVRRFRNVLNQLSHA